MSSTASLASSALSCPACDGPVEVKSRHVAIAGTAVRVYCSADCLRAGVRPVLPPAPALIEHATPPKRRRWIWWLGGGAASATCVIVALYARNDETVATAPIAPV